MELKAYFGSNPRSKDPDSYFGLNLARSMGLEVYLWSNPARSMHLQAYFRSNPARSMGQIRGSERIFWSNLAK